MLPALYARCSDAAQHATFFRGAAGFDSRLFACCARVSWRLPMNTYFLAEYMRERVARAQGQSWKLDKEILKETERLVLASVPKLCAMYLQSAARQAGR